MKKFETVVDKVDLKMEIARRIIDWRSLGTALDVPASIISIIGTDGAINERCLKVLKYHVDSKQLDSEPDWGYWKYLLHQFRDGRFVIEEMELELNISIMEMRCPMIDHDDFIFDELSKSCGAQWEFIGIFIGLDYSDVERLSANNENCEDKLLEIFKEKIGTEEGLTWPMIRRALSYLNLNRHIKEIEDNPSYKHLTSGSYELPRPNWLFFMAYASFKISSFWERLGMELKVQEIDTIKIDNVLYRGLKSKAFAVLYAKYCSEDGLNWTMLRNALKNCGRSDVIRDINKIQEFKHLL